MIMTPLIMLPNRRTAKRQRARNFTDDIERQHDDRRLRVGLQITGQSLLPNAKERDGNKHTQRQRRRGR